jgi:hypothetical protein
LTALPLQIRNLLTNYPLGPINHARGGLKTTLHEKFWKKAGKILRFGRLIDIV